MMSNVFPRQVDLSLYFKTYAHDKVIDERRLTTSKLVKLDDKYVMRVNQVVTM